MAILGIISAALAGAFMSIQGVMNTRLSEKIGLLESNAFVQGTAFLLSILAVFMFGKGNFSAIFTSKPQYLLGGILGLGITILVMLAMKNQSPTIAVSIILITQLSVAAAIDAFGLMGTEKIAFHWTKIVGLLLMIGGVILFKIKETSL